MRRNDYSRLEAFQHCWKRTKRRSYLLPSYKECCYHEIKQLIKWQLLTNCLYYFTLISELSLLNMDWVQAGYKLQQNKSLVRKCSPEVRNIYRERDSNSTSGWMVSRYHIRSGIMLWLVRVLVDWSAGQFAGRHRQIGIILWGRRWKLGGSRYCRYDLAYQHKVSRWS